MREIVSDVFTWSWFSDPHGYNFNGYLIRRAEGNLCVDPVEPGDDDLDEIARAGVARILLTNRNHGRAANRVRALTGARTAIHPDDSAHARDQGAELDDALHVGEVIGNPPGHCGLLREQVMDDPARLRANVRRLLDLDFDTLLVGDGEPILEGAKARLEELVETFPE